MDVSSESSDGAHVQEEASNMTFEDPQLMPRFSYRHSVRLPSVPHPTALDELKAAPRSSFRHSRRIPDNDSSRFKCLPRSSSFMDFHDGQSLAPLDDEGDTKSRDTPGVWSGMSFEDADSFDTFGTLPSNSNLSLEHKQEPIMPTPAANATSPRPISDESEKPIFPAIPLHRNKPEDRPIKKHGDEEEDGTLDVPRGLVHQPGAQGALRDLQRASVTAGNEIATSLRLIGDAQQKNGVSEAKKKSLSRVQGDILLRSRIFRRWNVRYASIIHQGYFGAVLLLFRPEQRSTLGGIALRNSKMIALTETSVRKVENAKRPKPYMFELKTSQRTYTFACNEESGRDFWMSKLKGHGS